MFALRIIVLVTLLSVLTWKAFYLTWPAVNDQAGPKVHVRVIDSLFTQYTITNDQQKIERVRITCNEEGDGMEGEFIKVKQFPVRVYIQAVDRGGVWYVKIPIGNGVKLGEHSENLSWEPKSPGGPGLIYQGDKKLGQHRVVLYFELSPSNTHFMGISHRQMYLSDYFGNTTKINLPSAVPEDAFCDFVNGVNVE